MSRCVVCGHNSVGNFSVTLANGRTYDFDTFQCAIDRLAPRCSRCGIRIIGHPTVVDGGLFCGPHCSQFLGIHHFV